MRSCYNCLHRNEPAEICCNSCKYTRNWEHDGKPSPCDGCIYFGLYEVNRRKCWHCVDGSRKVMDGKYNKKMYKLPHENIKNGR